MWSPFFYLTTYFHDKTNLILIGIAQEGIEFLILFQMRLAKYIRSILMSEPQFFYINVLFSWKYFYLFNPYLCVLLFEMNSNNLNKYP